MSQEKPYIRIFIDTGGERIHDYGSDMSLADFGGVLPSVGDVILNEGVLQGVDRARPENREMWVVQKRVFNAGDSKDYIALVIQQRPLEDSEFVFVPRG